MKNTHSLVFKLTTKIITAVYFKVWYVPPRVRWGSANLNSIQAKEVVQKNTWMSVH